MSTLRDKVVGLARWAVTNKSKFRYAEVRPIQLNINADPIIDDCSGTVTLIYHQAGAPDPNGLNYDGRGNTETLAAHGKEVTIPEPGDLVIYYGDEDRLPGFTEHVAIVIETYYHSRSEPLNYLTVSHGMASEPAYVTVSQDGRPHRFFSYLPSEADELLADTAQELQDASVQSGSNVVDVPEMEHLEEKADEVTKPSGNESDPRANQPPTYDPPAPSTPAVEPAPPESEVETTPAGVEVHQVTVDVPGPVTEGLLAKINEFIAHVVEA
jgi:hypothetical protein